MLWLPSRGQVSCPKSHLGERLWAAASLNSYREVCAQGQCMTIWNGWRKQLKLIKPLIMGMLGKKWSKTQISAIWFPRDMTVAVQTSLGEPVSQSHVTPGSMGTESCTPNSITMQKEVAFYWTSQDFIISFTLKIHFWSLSDNSLPPASVLCFRGWSGGTW